MTGSTSSLVTVNGMKIPNLWKKLPKEGGEPVSSLMDEPKLSRGTRCSGYAEVWDVAQQVRLESTDIRCLYTINDLLSVLQYAEGFPAAVAVQKEKPTRLITYDTGGRTFPLQFTIVNLHRKQSLNR